jgi:hypothetical protein
MTFTDTKFMSAKDKELMVKDWERFIKALAQGDLGTVTQTEYGAISKKFTKRIYLHVSLHCGFIAHYNISGFYGEYFDRPEDTVRFIDQWDRSKGCPPAEMGGCLPEYQDVNIAMMDIVDLYKIEIAARCHRQIKERDVAQGKALLAKHGVAV